MTTLHLVHGGVRVLYCNSVSYCNSRTTRKSLLYFLLFSYTVIKIITEELIFFKVIFTGEVKS